MGRWTDVWYNENGVVTTWVSTPEGGIASHVQLRVILPGQVRGYIKVQTIRRPKDKTAIDTRHIPLTSLKNSPVVYTAMGEGGLDWKTQVYNGTNRALYVSDRVWKGYV